MPEQTIVVALLSRPNTLNEHWAAKLIDLKRALKAAAPLAKQYGIPEGQDVRGIFVAPEYFFTAKREDFYKPRSLSEFDKNLLALEFQALSRLYRGWLIVPGTVAWKKDAIRPHERHERRKAPPGNDRTEPKRPRVDKAIDELGNVPARVKALPRELQPVVVQGSVHIIPSIGDRLGVLEDQRQGRGDLEFLARNTAYVVWNGMVVLKYNKMYDFHEAIGDHGVLFVPGNRPGLFQVGGINFGLEICRDHGCDLLKNIFVPDGPSLPFKEKPHIHILASDHVENRYAYVQEGGFMIHASTVESLTEVWGNDAAENLTLSDPLVERKPKIDVGGGTMKIFTIKFED